MRTNKYTYLIFFIFLLFWYGNSQAADLPRLDIACDELTSVNIFRTEDGVPLADGHCSGNHYFVVFFQNAERALTFNKWINSHQGHWVNIYVNNVNIFSEVELPSVQPLQIPVSRYFSSSEAFCSADEARQYAKTICPDKLDRLKEKFPGFVLVE